MSLHIVDTYDNQIYHLNTEFLNKTDIVFDENVSYNFSLKKLRLKSGNYNIWLWLFSNGKEQDFISKGLGFCVQEGNIYNYARSSHVSGVVQPDFNFNEE